MSNMANKSGPKVLCIALRKLKLCHDLVNNGIEWKLCKVFSTISDSDERVHREMGAISSKHFPFLAFTVNHDPLNKDRRALNKSKSLVKDCLGFHVNSDTVAALVDGVGDTETQWVLTTSEYLKHFSTQENLTVDAFFEKNFEDDKLKVFLPSPFTLQSNIHNRTEVVLKSLIKSQTRGDSSKQSNCLSKNLRSNEKESQRGKMAKKTTTPKVIPSRLPTKSNCRFKRNHTVTKDCSDDFLSESSTSANDQNIGTSNMPPVPGIPSTKSSGKQQLKDSKTISKVDGKEGHTRKHDEIESCRESKGIRASQSVIDGAWRAGTSALPMKRHSENQEKDGYEDINRRMSRTDTASPIKQHHDSTTRDHVIPKQKSRKYINDKNELENSSKLVITPKRSDLSTSVSNQTKGSLDLPVVQCLSSTSSHGNRKSSDPMCSSKVDQKENPNEEQGEIERRVDSKENISSQSVTDVAVRTGTLDSTAKKLTEGSGKGECGDFKIKKHTKDIASPVKQHRESPTRGSVTLEQTSAKCTNNENRSGRKSSNLDVTPKKIESSISDQTKGSSNLPTRQGMPSTKSSGEQPSKDSMTTSTVDGKEVFTRKTGEIDRHLDGKGNRAYQTIIDLSSRVSSSDSAVEKRTEDSVIPKQASTKCTHHENELENKSSNLEIGPNKSESSTSVGDQTKRSSNLPKSHGKQQPSDLMGAPKVDRKRDRSGKHSEVEKSRYGKGDRASQSVIDVASRACTSDSPMNMVKRRIEDSGKDRDGNTKRRKSGKDVAPLIKQHHYHSHTRDSVNSKQLSTKCTNNEIGFEVKSSNLAVAPKKSELSTSVSDQTKGSSNLQVVKGMPSMKSFGKHQSTILVTTSKVNRKEDCTGKHDELKKRPDGKENKASQTLVDVALRASNSESPMKRRTEDTVKDKYEDIKRRKSGKDTAPPIKTYHDSPTRDSVIPKQTSTSCTSYKKGSEKKNSNLAVAPKKCESSTSISNQNKGSSNLPKSHGKQQSSDSMSTSKIDGKREPSGRDGKVERRRGDNGDRPSQSVRDGASRAGTSDSPVKRHLEDSGKDGYKDTKRRKYSNERTYDQRSAASRSLSMDAKSNSTTHELTTTHEYEISDFKSSHSKQARESGSAKKESDTSVRLFDYRVCKRDKIPDLRSPSNSRKNGNAKKHSFKNTHKLAINQNRQASHSRNWGSQIGDTKRRRSTDHRSHERRSEVRSQGEIRRGEPYKTARDKGQDRFSLLIGDSMLESIVPQELSRIKHTKVVPVPDAKVGTIGEMISTHARNPNCDEVILHVGNNDVKHDELHPSTIASSIERVGLNLQKAIPNKVSFTISGIISTYRFMNSNTLNLNSQLKLLALKHGWAYICHDNIYRERHMYNHKLNKLGKRYFASNIIAHLRTEKRRSDSSRSPTALSFRRQHGATHGIPKGYHFPGYFGR